MMMSTKVEDPTITIVREACVAGVRHELPAPRAICPPWNAGPPRCADNPGTPVFAEWRPQGDRRIRVWLELRECYEEEEAARAEMALALWTALLILPPWTKPDGAGFEEAAAVLRNHAAMLEVSAGVERRNEELAALAATS